MSVSHQLRGSWSGRRNLSDAQDGRRKGVAVHWPGFRFSIAKHADCLGLLARLEREAMANDYAALPYNEAACPHGYRIEGRGVSKRSAANGSNSANDQYGSVLALVPVGGKPSDAMLTAIHACLTAQAPGGRLVTHNDVRPVGTACPGPALTAWIRKGAPKPAPAGKRTHTVNKGETLWSLAERYYRDGAKWQKIATANDLDGTDLQPGDKLVIP